MFTKQAAGIVCPAVFFYGCIEKFISALNTLKTTKKASYSRLFITLSITCKQLFITSLDQL